MTVTIDEVHNSLSELLERVKASSEEIIVADGATPVARVLPVPDGHEKARSLRHPGMDAGKIWMADDFEGPLPDEITDEFYE